MKSWDSGFRVGMDWDLRQAKIEMTIEGSKANKQAEMMLPACRVNKGACHFQSGKYAVSDLPKNLRLTWEVMVSIPFMKASHRMDTPMKTQSSPATGFV